ncbi:MAG TPA: hypothetical protein VF693_06445 [Allosphingosinicella sp.]|jgi:hypothetical protein
MRLILALAAASAVAGCATTYGDYDSGRYRYDGSAWAERRGGGDLRGPGVDILDPWLVETPEGRQIVRSGWRSARRGRVDVQTAERANIWFRRHADADRDLCLTDVEIRSALAQSAYHIAHLRTR